MRSKDKLPKLPNEGAAIVISGGDPAGRRKAAAALRQAGFAPVDGAADGPLAAALGGDDQFREEAPVWRDDAAAEVAAATLEQPAALILFNLDHFKRVRAVVGSEIARRLLKEAFARVEDCLKAHDASRGRRGKHRGQVRHVDGDEFCVLMPRLDHSEEAAEFAHAALVAIGRPYEKIAPQVFLTGRAGITLAPHHSRDVDTLFRMVASIVHHESRQGRNTVRVYAPGAVASAAERFELEAELSRAVRAGELEVYYQPQLCIATNRLVGAEALVRWRRAGIGSVPAEVFIAVAEDLGLIAELGNWVLTTAARQIESWRKAGLPPVRIAINTSAYQFRRLDMVDVVVDALKKTDVAADYLMLEVTESLVLSEVERTLDALRRLQEMGIKIALDDFGTGYSSLSYLKSFALDCLKIDLSFVRGLPQDSGDVAVTEAIIRMAKALNLEVIAEGVEREEQRACLAALGCDYYQGYLIARPMPADAFGQLLGRGLTVE